MTDFISGEDLASYLDRDPDFATRARVVSIVQRTNRLITEVWESPVDPTPAKVLDLALAIGARAWGIDPSKPQIESVSRTSDGTSKTERYATPVGARNGRDVFITADELAELNPASSRRRRPRSIRLHVP